MTEIEGQPIIINTVLCLALVSLYALSFGPVIGWFAAKRIVVSRGVSIFYWPLIQVAKVTPMWDALEKYVGNCFMLWRQWLP
jgi:hypothetical protein